MHIYFSGVGGVGISALALFAKQVGYEISGSDKQLSCNFSYLQNQGVDSIHLGQTTEAIQDIHRSHPIDWFVYSSALIMENPNHPELVYCKAKNIKVSKRDEFLIKLLKDNNLQMIAIAGTHGKTTTTAMTIWLMQELGVPISYMLAAKTSFSCVAQYNPKSTYFIYEADEFDRNFLAYHPLQAMITGIDWDHPDIYPSLHSYNKAFHQFINQSMRTVIWNTDAAKINILKSDSVSILNIKKDFFSTLPGLVNRQNAALVAQGIAQVLREDNIALYMKILNRFPGLSRRFEQIIPGLYTDYAHTPPKIRGALQLGHEIAGDNLVVVYEGLHNTRQHFIKKELLYLFSLVRFLHIVPSYLARENASLKLLSPADLKYFMSKGTQERTTSSQLDNDLKHTIKKHIAEGNLVLCLTAGSSRSLDEWLRTEFVKIE